MKVLLKVIGIPASMGPGRFSPWNRILENQIRGLLERLQWGQGGLVPGITQLPLVHHCTTARFNGAREV